MQARVTALLIHDQPEPLSALKIALDEHAIRTCRAQSCREALDWFRSQNPPRVVLTDEMLPDGIWEDIVRIGANGHEPTSVIVVGRRFDLTLHAEVIQCGAFDFIAPPFVASDLVHVVRCAMGNAISQQNAQLAVA